MATGTDDSVRNTYRYLRAAPLALALFLGLGVWLQSRAADCVESSISATYYTSNHAVFVAALCAIGVCLIAYQGSSPFEDVVLNLSGFLAFLVAMVPTFEDPVRLCRDAAAVIDPLPASIRLNVAAVFGAAAVAEAVRWVFVRPLWRLPQDSQYRRWYVLVVAGVGYLLVLFLAWRYLSDFEGWFVRNAHNWSAVSMFGGIVLLILINGVGAVREILGAPARRTRTVLATAAYLVSALGMIGGLALTLWRRSAQGLPDVFGAEVVVIAAFALFWLTQTLELWNATDRQAKRDAEGIVVPPLGATG